MSGFVCEAFGYIPRTGESIKVVLEKGNEEEDDENAEAGSDQQDMKESHQIYKLEVWFEPLCHMCLYCIAFLFSPL